MERMLNLHWRCAAAVALGVFLAGTASAQTFARLADTTTQIPGSGDVFATFGAPAYDGAHYAFYGKGGGSEGIYANLGAGLQTLVNRFTIMPGTSVNFAFFSGPILEAGKALVGGTGAGQWQGIYTTTGGALTIVADKNTLIPGGGGVKFSSFSGFDLDDDRVVFRGLSSLSIADGIYRQDGAGGLVVIADKSTLVPGGSDPFQGFGPGPTASGDSVVFRGVTVEGEGIYALLSGALTTVADIHTPVPNGTGDLAGFDGPAISGETIVFIGLDSSFIPGIYGSEKGRLGLVADTLTPIPDGAGSFIGFDINLALDATGIAFLGIGNDGQSGIYTTAEGDGLKRVIAVNDVLDGKTVSELSLSRDGLIGYELAFTARFTDGTAGVYLADLPSPPPVCLGDFNGDLVIDLSDLAILLANYGTSGVGDLNSDGIVDLVDLAALLAIYGTTCG